MTAGRKKAPLTPGRRRLREEMNKTLSAATALDRIDEGAGERLREAAATALHATRARSIRSSESEVDSGPKSRTY